jgi:heme-degrading monooxygenase HmoA
MYTVIVLHHAVPEHTERFIAFMHEVAEAVAGSDGLIDFRTCREAEGRYLAGVSHWASRDAFAAAVPTIMGLAPRRDPRWTARPDERMTLVDT